jgi:broad specificity phosphatase PhoE
VARLPAKTATRGDTARLTLLCHAATKAARTAAFPADEPLDAKGAAAAAALAGRWQAAGRVLASPARRAGETAAAMGLTAQAEAALRDCDYGRWAGSSLSDVAAREPEAVAAWLADPDAAPHGGESLSALLSRVSAWMDSGGLQGPVLAITHTAVIRAAVLHALGAPAKSFWRIDAAPLSMIELRRNGAHWALYAAQMPAPERLDGHA